MDLVAACAALCQSAQMRPISLSAGVTRGRNGFHKDKSGEKLAETEDDRLELRTDGTDAFDTLYIGCENFPYFGGSFVDVSGVM